MNSKDKIKLLKVLAFPASAAFMMGVGATAIHAEEADTTITTSADPDTEVEVLGEANTVETVEVVEDTTEETTDSSEEESTSEDSSVEEDQTTNQTNTTESVQAVSTPVKAPSPVQQSTIYINDNSSKTFTNLQDAVNESVNGDTIHMGGMFAFVDPVTINKNIVLDILRDTSIVGQGKDGIILAANSGAKIQTSNGATLSMSGFNNAITISGGTTLTDGNYVFNNNAHGLVIGGDIIGSEKGKLNITATYNGSSSEKNDISPIYFTSWKGKSTLNITNAIINADNNTTSQTLASSCLYGDSPTVYFKNCDFNTSGIYFQLIFLNFDNTNAKIDGNEWGYSDATGYDTNQGYDRNLLWTNNSVIEFSNWNKCGITTLVNELKISNGTKVILNNDSNAGINVRIIDNVTNYTPTLVVENSTIETDGTTGNLIAGSQTRSGVTGKLIVSGNSVVNSPATASKHNLGAGGTGNFIVVGGSFKIYYDKDYNSSYGSTIPVNEQGTTLSYFQLKDGSIVVINAKNPDGTTYDYDVANASSDGNKYVWVPGESVNFHLNGGNIDGNTSDFTYMTMRGYTLNDVVSFNGQSFELKNPSRIGYTFDGWYLDEACTQKVDVSTLTIDKLTNLYAKWILDGQSYGIVYDNNLSSSDTYEMAGENTDYTITVVSIDQLANSKDSFKAPGGKTFIAWNTKADGSGTTYKVGDIITLSKDNNTLTLYALWETEYYTVKFSANGGTFTESSVFKKYPNIFRIEKDANGGEVAVLVGQLEYNQSLNDYLISLGYSDGVNSSTEIYSSSWGNSAIYNCATRKYYVQVPTWGNDESTWYTDAQGKQYATLRYSSFLGYVFDNSKITDNTTYYLSWKLDDSIKEIKETFNLPSDMFGTDESKTTKIENKEVGDTVTITGAIDTTGIKSAMKNIELLFPQEAATPESISLANLSSTFTATLTIPSGITIPSDITVTPTGFGDAFEIDSYSVNGNVITVILKLKDGITNYKQLQDAVNGADDTLLVTVSGLKLDNANNGDLLTIEGDIDGTFSAIADNGTTSYNFNFTWNGQQEDSKKDEATSSGITYTIRAVAPIDTKLDGDITVGKDTEHTSVYETTVKDSIDFTGKLNVDTIKKQLQAIKGSQDTSDIKIDVEKFTFTATFTIPEGMSIPEQLTVLSEDFGDGFTIESTSVNGNTVTVIFKLNQEVSTFDELENIVNQAGGEDGWMKITLYGITVDTKGQKTVVGTVTGEFKATATKNDNEQVYWFTWEAIQNADGKDVTAQDDTTIQFTLKTPTAQKDNLNADILINETDTEHDKITVVNKGEYYTYTGALNVQKIKDQMAAIEALYPNVDHDKIQIDVRDFSFVATFTIPNGLILPEDLVAQPEQFGNGFSIESTTINGNTVTVIFKLTDFISNYAELEDVVDQAGGEDGWMKIHLYGIQVSEDVEDLSKLTVVGTVDGTFTAIATNEEGTRKAFSFEWTSSQWADGKDADATDDDTIQLTVMVPYTESKDLNGDIAVDKGDGLNQDSSYDTEHTSVVEVKKSDTLTIGFSLDTTTIKKQMDEIEKQMAAKFGRGDSIPDDIRNQITLDGTTSTFYANIWFPGDIDVENAQFSFKSLSGMDYDAGDPSGMFDFKLLPVTRGYGGVVIYQLQMTLKEEYTKYIDLYNAVQAEPDYLTIILSNVKISDSAKTNENITIKGSVGGTMSATASYHGYEVPFQFTWTGKQDTNMSGIGDGTDFILGENTDGDIWLTLVVKEDQQPDDDDNKPDDNKKEDENKKEDTTDDSKKEKESKEDTSSNEVQTLSVQQGSGSTGEVNTSVSSDAGMLSMTTLITGLGAILLRKRRDDE